MLWMCIWMYPYNVTPAIWLCFWKIASILVITPRGEPQHSVVIEAMDPFKLAPTSMSNTCKLCHHLHMLWMCMWICPYNVTASLFCHTFGKW